MTATAHFTTPTGVMLMIDAANAKALRAELAELGVSLNTAGDPTGAASATITPAKQEAARASTAAGKAQAKGDTKETPPADDGKAQEEAAAKAAAAEKLAALRAEASAAIVKLASDNQPAAIELLASFNCKRAKELADDQLADALAKATAALKAAPADLS